MSTASEAKISKLLITTLNNNMCKFLDVVLFALYSANFKFLFLEFVIILDHDFLFPVKIYICESNIRSEKKCLIRILTLCIFQ